MTYSISTKIQDGSQNLEKSKLFRVPRGVVLSTLSGARFARNTSISYDFQDKHFPFLPNARWQTKFAKG